MKFRVGVAAVLGSLMTLSLAGCATDSSNGVVRGLADRSELASLAAEFEPGNIVSDEQFFDDTALSADGVQSFFDRVDCAPKDTVTCLADLRLRLPAIPAESSIPGHCDAIAGAAQLRAADVVVAVARACGVSPKLLIVLMQKEQSLLTRPSASGYERATGYGCPDTSDCQSKYFGLVNQLYNAAWQFRQYSLQPVRKFHVGEVAVPFHPNSDCGSEPVTIANQATANLYNYTPYQPNTAARANPNGDGDACSSWGNLNVWLLWNVWFGDPRAEPLPGYLSPCVTHHNGVRCPGVDPEKLFGGRATP